MLNTLVLFVGMIWRWNSFAAEEDAVSSVSSLIQAGLVRKDIQPPKTCSNIPIDRQLPDGD